MPETNPQFERRVMLYESVKCELAAVSTIGSDQFVYWDPTSVVKRFAPDLFVKVGVPHVPVDVWKVWERGAPEVGVEIVSKSDRPEDEWGEKLARYRAAGVREVVRFDAEDLEQPIHVWDHVDGELVERVPDDPDMRACHALGLWWVVGNAPQLGPTLRLARDKEGRDLLPTPAEARARAEQERALAEQERARAEQERASEATARALAEQERDALRQELEALRAKAAKPAPVPRKKTGGRKK